MLLIEAALANGVRPTAFILGSNSLKKWSKWDILLALAYQIFQSERCGQCGQMKWVCHNESDDARIEFNIHRDVCYGQRELDMDAEDKQRDENYKAPAGEVRMAIPFSRTKTPFDWKMRDAYYKVQSERRQQV